MKRISTGKEAVVQVIGAGAPQIVCVGPLQSHLKYHKRTLEYSVLSMPCFLSQGPLTPCTLDRDCQDLQFTDTGKKDTGGGVVYHRAHRAVTLFGVTILSDRVHF